MMAFQSPNYTMVPNELFDMMPTMSEAELKATLTIIRQTKGYHRPTDALSYSQLMTFTGMAKPACMKGVKEACQRGTVELAGHGKRGVHIYRLMDAPTGNRKLPVNETSGNNLLPDNAPTGNRKLPDNPATGNRKLPTKEKVLERKDQSKENQSAPEGAGSNTSTSEEKETGIIQRQKTDLIKAWWDALPEINRPLRTKPPKVYQIPAYLEDAEAAIRRGITPEKMTAYVKGVTYQGQYWHAKVLRFRTACENAPGWCIGNYRPPQPAYTPDDDFGNIQLSDLPPIAQEAITGLIEAWT